MYRITTYDGDSKDIDEVNDFDVVADLVESCLRDLSNRHITGFTVSRLGSKPSYYKKPFWEKDEDKSNDSPFYPTTPLP